MGNMFGSDESEELTGTISQPEMNAPVGAVSGQPLPAPNGMASSPIATGSIPSVAQNNHADASLPVKISPMDWGYARGALGLALTGPENTPPVPWANPDTGVRGSFAPSAPPEVHNGVTCRSFVASRYEQSNSQKMAGKACQTAEGYWSIEEAKPVL